MPLMEREGSIEEIRVPMDLDLLDRHNAINQRLVDERAAGSPKIVEDLLVATELVGRIEEELIEDDGSLELYLDERERQILGVARRMGGIATPRATQQ